MTNSQPSTELPDAHGSEYELTVPACYGKSFEVEKGQYLTVTDVEGRQVGDFVAFNLHDVTECLSTAHTRLLWGPHLSRSGRPVHQQLFELDAQYRQRRRRAA